jgi:hypothetical protein
MKRFPLYVYHASRKHVPAKMRAFINFIRESLIVGTGTASRPGPAAGGNATALPLPVDA